MPLQFVAVSSIKRSNMMQALKNFFTRKKKKKDTSSSTMSTVSTISTATEDSDGVHMKKKKLRTKRKKNRESSSASSDPVSITTTAAPVAPAPGGSIILNCTQMSVIPEKTDHAHKAAITKMFIEGTLQKGIKGLIADFRSRKRVLDIEAMSEFSKQNAEGRNRYKDVGCLDCTRVVLNLGPVPYIHANYVSTPSHPKKFICTQAPLPKTCADFWYMVVQEKSTVILMLCNIMERGANKCAQYFPVENGGTLTFEDSITVTIKSQETMQFPFESKVKIIISQIEVSIAGQPPHTCAHYHWQDWPDRGVPEADMAPIHLLKSIRDCAPIIVHCSAGIGRTGSMVLIQHVMDLLNAEQPLEATLVNYMEELRKQRNNSVQTEHQYLYVHQVMLLFMQQNGYMNVDVYKDAMAKFTADYQKATSAFGA